MMENPAIYLRKRILAYEPERIGEVVISKAVPIGYIKNILKYISDVCTDCSGYEHCDGSCGGEDCDCLCFGSQLKLERLIKEISKT